MCIIDRGNGTEALLRGDARVLVCSTYQHPFYPFGSQEPAENIVRVPLVQGTSSSALREALEIAWLPALRNFSPELLMISAGFDGHAEDGIANTYWTEGDYGWITAELRAVAEATCGGRIVSVLEGGYALQALGRSVAAHVRALL